MLESLFAPLLSGIMGKYFSNFDSSKLNISILGGYTEFTEMLLRPSFLDRFKLPFKLVFGKVGRIEINYALTTFMYGNTRDVGIVLKDVYILVGPASSIQVTEADDIEKKRNALEQLIAQDPDLNVETTNEAGESSPAMLIGIINNIKIDIENIHIRYEDELTNPGSPFSCGLILQKLAAVSTDGKWAPASTDASAETFYKLVRLENFGIYWNSKTECVRPSKDTPDAVTASIVKMEQLIGPANHELNYLLGNISGQAKATVTLKPHKLEQEFSKPLADVQVEMENIDMNLTDQQFRDALLLMETFEDQSRRTPYLSMRPLDIPYKENAKKWWKYAYNCIQVGVRNKNLLYDAHYLVKQKELIAQYEVDYANYRQKLTLKKASDEEKEKLQKLEDQIGNQDILIIRKRVAFKDKTIVASQETTGWGFWKGNVPLDPVKLKEVLAVKLTPEQMKEFQEFINLDAEDSDAKNFPPGYTQFKFDFTLPRVTFNVHQVMEHNQKVAIIQFCCKNITTKAEVYPAENGLWAELTLGDIGLTGFVTKEVVPSLARNVESNEGKFVVINYEKNPRNSKQGQHIRIRTMRLEIIYDSSTIQKLFETLQFPSGVELQKTSATVSDAMKQAKNLSANGIKDMIENTNEVYLDISIQAPYIIVPSGGSNASADTFLIFNFGHLSIKTVPRERSITDSKNTNLVGFKDDGDLTLETLKLTYNQYFATCEQVELLVALKGENIRAAINHTFPPDPPGTQIYHADRPAILFRADVVNGFINQCIIKDDTRFPKINIFVKVPLFDFKITNYRLLKLLRLVFTIPVPTAPPAPPSKFLHGVEDKTFQPRIDRLINEKTIEDEHGEEDESGEVEPFDPEKTPQFVAFAIKLQIVRVKVLLLRLNEVDHSTTPLMDVDTDNFVVKARIQTYGLLIDMALDAINVRYLNTYQPNAAPGATVYFLHTAEGNPESHVVKFHMFLISPGCPKAKVGIIHQKIEFALGSIEVGLHQEGLESLIVIADRILDEFPGKSSVTKHKAKKGRVAELTKAFGLSKLANAGDVLLKLSLSLTDVRVQVTSEKKRFAAFELSEVLVDFEDKPLVSRVFGQINGICMINLDMPSLYKQIMKSDPEKPFAHGTATIHKHPLRSTDPYVEVQFRLECPPIVCIGAYVGNIIDFACHLQLARDSFKESESEASAAVTAPVTEVEEAAGPQGNLANLKLDIKVRSPTLIIVKDTMSMDAVVIDLGRLKLTNNLTEVAKVGSEMVAVVDHMTVSVTGLNISRVHTMSGDIESEVRMLKDIVVSVEVARNLSPWYTLVPAFDVSLALTPIEIHISSRDVELATNCVFGYIQRVKHSVDTVQALAAGTFNDDPDDETKDQAGGLDLMGSASAIPVTNAQKLGLNVKLDQLGLIIYHTPTHLDGKHGNVERDPNNALAKCYVQTVDLGVKMWKNENLDVNLSVNEILLSDARKETGGIKDFIVKKEYPDTPVAPVLNLEFSTQNNSGESTIYNIKMDNHGLSVVFYVQFMKLLAEFVMSIVNGLPTEDKIKIEDSTFANLDKRNKRKKKKVEKPVEEKGLPLINANLNLRQGELSILEDLNSTDTNAIIAYGQAEMKMESDKQNGSFGGGQWDFGVYTGKYKSEDMSVKIADIIKPAQMKFTASVSKDTGTNLGIDFSEVFLHINAGTVLLLTKFGKDIQEVLQANEQARAASETTRRDYGNVWSPKLNAEQGYWFLDFKALSTTVNRHNELATGSPSTPIANLVESTKKLPESFRLTLVRGAIVIEAGVAAKPTPMLLFEGHVGVQLNNWSSNLNLNGSVGGCAYYNNVIKGTWEYLIEPNEVNDEDTFGEPGREPWEFQINVLQKPKVGNKSPMAITVKSEEILELTVSKTCIDLMKALAVNFVESVTHAQNEGDVNTPPYIFFNDVGTDVWLELDDKETSLTYIKEGEVQKGKTLVRAGDKIDLGMEMQDVRTRPGDQKERVLTVSIPEFSNFRENVTVRYNGTRYFQLRDNNGKSFGVLLELKAQVNFSTLISVRSVVEVTSGLSAPVDITAVVSGKSTHIGTVPPYQTINFPLSALRTGVVVVALEFTTTGYKKSARTQAFAALARATDKTRDFVLAKSETGGPDGKIRVIGSVTLSQIQGKGGAPTGRNYRLLLRPPLIVNNFFALAIDVSTDGKSFLTIPPGHPMDILTADTEASNSRLFVKLNNFQNTNWTAEIRLTLKPSRSFLGSSDYIKPTEINFIEFKSATGRSLFFRFRPTIFEDKLEELSFFCPFWMVNRTGLPLSYQGLKSSGPNSRISHPADNPGPNMMTYEVGGKEKVKFSVADSDWSDALNIDAAMSVPVLCKGKGRDYEVVVSVELSQSQLTKIVSFLPKYTLNNSSPFNVVVSESGEFGAEVTIPANTVIPFWPKRHAGHTCFLLLKVEGTEEYTSPILFDGVNVSLLKLSNKYGGLTVNVNVLESSGSLTITEFKVTEVPVLIVNDSADLQIEFQQTSIGQPSVIPPRNGVIYSWDDLSKPQEITWYPTLCKDSLGFPTTFGVSKPASGHFSVTKEEKNKNYYWATFLSGIRTIFVLTANPKLLSIVEDYLDFGKQQSEAHKEGPDGNTCCALLDIALQLEGIGLSFVDDHECKDILYLRLEGTPPMWEGSSGNSNRFKTLTADEIVTVEKGYVNFVAGKNKSRPVTLEGGMKIDYINFDMFAPRALKLRRHAYQPAIGIKYKKYEYSQEVSLTIAKIQIDNQLEDAEYPHLLQIVPIPKTVANKSEIAPPFLIVNYKDWAQGGQVKTLNAAVILQEFRVALDSVLVTSAIAVFLPSDTTNPSKHTKTQYDDDYKKASSSNEAFYSSEIDRISAETAVTIYQLLQIFKIKVKVTASLNPDTTEDIVFRNMLLGLGSAAVSISDVGIELDGLEIKQKRWTKAQLTDAIVAHYKRQVLENLYKVVLGLDILGNPSKLLGGAATGLMKLVTEPVQGAMDGNFVEGISNGAEAALDGTILGLTDALGTVTKQLGKLTGGLGIPGVPNLLGFVSGNLHSLGEKVGESKHKEIESLRPRRIMTENTPLKPYSHYATIGQTVYKQLNEDYPDCGAYVSHFLNVDAKKNWEILLLAQNRVYYAGATPKLDSLHKKWVYKWSQVEKVEKTTNNEIRFKEPTHGFRMGFGIIPMAEKLVPYPPKILQVVFPNVQDAWKNAKRK